MREIDFTHLSNAIMKEAYAKLCELHSASMHQEKQKEIIRDRRSSESPRRPSIASSHEGSFVRFERLSRRKKPFDRESRTRSSPQGRCEML